MQLLFLELNEINFDYVRRYVKAGLLPAFERLLDRHSVQETVSEKEHEALEPWIQWVTAHTGLPLADHGIFRLGDIVRHDIPQIWEILESQGLKVGAISPMNAKNRCRNAAFFVPDPWTPTEVTGPPLLRRLSAAIAQAVNENATARLSFGSGFWLIAGLCRYARPRNYGRYFGLLWQGLTGRKWARALILDQLLADIFIRQVRSGKPDFASLFLNAGAHVQHHYMFNSAAYPGDLRNPDWYIRPTLDPLLAVYGLYDRILGQVVSAFPDARLMIATGLHQDPNPQLTFYWRLKDHAAFLASHDIPFARVDALMSRDFLVTCNSPEEASEAARRLAGICAPDGEPLFEIDNRGADLFVMLTWSHDVPEDFQYRAGNTPKAGLRQQVAFVALKNGAHNGIGYFVDTGAQQAEGVDRIELASLPSRVAAAFGQAPRPAPVVAASPKEPALPDAG